jgi:transcriptional repressor NrdR
MICPNCGFDQSKVVDSREASNGRAIRRRRECNECQFRYTTFERLQSSNFFVTKRSGISEPYDRQKIEHGILISCAKRPVALDNVREHLNELEEQWSRKSTVTTQQIGDDVLNKLKDLDEVAFIRFASVYKEFSDMESFQGAVDEVRGGE